MKNLFIALAFMLVGTFAFANNSIENKLNLESCKTELATTNDYTIVTNVDYQSADVCSITVSLYVDGELVGSGTWTDNTGDCDKAARYATTLAYIAYDLGD
jgi:hypothetical protein